MDYKLQLVSESEPFIAVSFPTPEPLRTDDVFYLGEDKYQVYSIRHTATPIQLNDKGNRVWPSAEPGEDPIKWPLPIARVFKLSDK